MSVILYDCFDEENQRGPDLLGAVQSVFFELKGMHSEALNLYRNSFGVNPVSDNSSCRLRVDIYYEQERCDMMKMSDTNRSRYASSAHQNVRVGRRHPCADGPDETDIERKISATRTLRCRKSWPVCPTRLMIELVDRFLVLLNRVWRLAMSSVMEK